MVEGGEGWKGVRGGGRGWEVTVGETKGKIRVC